MAVTIEELAGFPTFAINRETGWTARRRVKFLWADIDDLIEELFPPTILSGTTVTIQLPAEFPGRFWMNVDNVQIAPFDPSQSFTLDADGIMQHVDAVAEIDYKTNRFDLDPDTDTFLTHRWSVSGEHLTIPGYGLEWNTDGQTAASDNGIVQFIPIIHHEFTWNEVPDPPFATIRDNIGRVNATTFFEAAAETLLFTGAEASREIDNFGNFIWTLTYIFAERVVGGVANPAATIGWNHHFRAEENAGRWELVNTKNGDPPYALSTNFLGLFIGA